MYEVISTSYFKHGQQFLKKKLIIRKTFL